MLNINIMKKIMLLWAALLVSCTVGAQNVIVFAFKADTVVSRSFADSVSEVFISNFHPKKYVLEDRINVINAIENQGFDEKNMKRQHYLEVGKAMNASRIVVGEVGVAGDKYVVTAGVIRVSTAQTETKFKATISDISEKDKILKDLAEKIAYKLEAIRTSSKSFTVNDVTFEMIFVEGGTFVMGATPEQGDEAYDMEKPAHKVQLDDFYIGKYEVTQGLWKAVMGGKPTDYDAGWHGYGEGDDYPAYKISWNDCQEFIKNLNEITGENFRLPYEAEWEYAARGGNKSKGYKYSGSNEVGDVSWCVRNVTDSKTRPVGMKLPNELGIYDMSGNVWEWCQDWYGFYDDKMEKNPKGKLRGNNKVLRGGSWSRGARLSRVSNRGYNRTDVRLSFNGMRLVLTIDKDKIE